MNRSLAFWLFAGLVLCVSVVVLMWLGEAISSDIAEALAAAVKTGRCP